MLTPYCSNLYDNTVVLGERCSGTNLVQTLFGNKYNKNWCLDVENVRVSAGKKEHQSPFCWKHANVFSLMPPYSQFGHTQFIVIVRNPYDWINAFFHWQHQVKYRKTMREFITMPVIPISLRGLSGWSQILHNDVVNSGNYYNNPLHMRTVKYMAWLQLNTRVKCVNYIKFESVTENVSKFIRNFPIGTRYLSDISQRQSPTKHTSKDLITTYKRLTTDEIKLIRERLNIKLEHRLGYEI